MDLSDPFISRELTKLTRFIDGAVERLDFIDDARQAKDVGELLEKFRTYKKIGKSNWQIAFVSIAKVWANLRKKGGGIAFPFLLTFD